MESSSRLAPADVLLLPTVQARIQSPRAVRHRLHRQTVETPVWHGEGRLRATLQQEHHLHLPAPLPLPLRWQGRDIVTITVILSLPTLQTIAFFFFCLSSFASEARYSRVCPWAAFKSNKSNATWSQWERFWIKLQPRFEGQLSACVCVWIWTVKDFDGWTWQSMMFRCSSQSWGRFSARFCGFLSLLVWTSAFRTCIVQIMLKRYKFYQIKAIDQPFQGPTELR